MLLGLREEPVLRGFDPAGAEQRRVPAHGRQGQVGVGARAVLCVAPSPATLSCSALYYAALSCSMQCALCCVVFACVNVIFFHEYFSWLCLLSRSEEILYVQLDSR